MTSMDVNFDVACIELGNSDVNVNVAYIELDVV